MRNNWYKKSLVVGTIILFITLVFVPTINGGCTNERFFSSDVINNISISIDRGFLDQSILSNLSVHVETDKTIYKRFEPIQVTISVTNNGNEDWTHVFPDTQLADFDINGLYWWSIDKYFLQIITPVTIRSGETVILLQTYWNQFSNLIGYYPVPPGNYTIRGWIAFSKLYPTPPFGYSNITITKFKSKSVQQSSINNNFYQYTNQLFRLFFERFPNLFTMVR
jgi:hypothetical protein